MKYENMLINESTLVQSSGKGRATLNAQLFVSIKYEML